MPVMSDVNAGPIVNLCTVGSAAVGGIFTGVTWSGWPGNGGAGAGSYINATWSPTGKAYRMTWSTAPTSSGDTGFALGMSGIGALTPGQTYYAAMTVVASRTITMSANVGNWTPSGTGTANAGSGHVVVAGGQPTTFWISFTPGANVTGCKVYVSADAGQLWAVGDTLDASCAVVVATKSTAMAVLPFGGYFDGSGIGPASQALWTGTANQSTSVGYPLRSDAVVNLLPNPDASQVASNLYWTTYGGGNGLNTPVALSRAAVTGAVSSYAGHVAVTGTTATQANAEISPLGGALSGANSFFTATGNTYTLVCKMRSSSVRANGIIRFRSNAGDVIYTLTNQVGTSWTEVRATVTTLTLGRTYTVTYKETGSAAWAQGEWLEMTDVMLVAGTYTGPYASGVIPGWTWEGAAGASPSHGAPYTLATVAGTANWSGTVSGTSAPPSAFSARSMYCVFDVRNIDASWDSPMYVGDPTPANGALRFQMNSAGSSTMSTRIDTAGGASNISGGSAGTGLRTIGRHVGMVQINQGCTMARSAYDNSGVTSSSTFAAGTGIPGSVVNLLTVTTTSVGAVFGAQFFNYHDEWTVGRVLGWLARQYGVTPPLAEIAGPPLAINTTPNSTVTYTAPAATAGRTMYAVHNTTDYTQTNALAIAAIGVGVTSTGAAGAGQMGYRHNLSGAVALRAQSLSGTATAVNVPSATNGLHVGCGWMVEGDLGFGAMIDGGPDVTATQVPSGGQQVGTANFVLAAATASDTPIAAYLFTGTHDRVTRLRITAWLARQYGATPPPGY